MKWIQITSASITVFVDGKPVRYSHGPPICVRDDIADEFVKMGYAKHAFEHVEAPKTEGKKVEEKG